MDNKKPKLRFKGFTDDWEQRKVGEIIEDYIERTTIQNQYPVLTSSQQQGIVLQEDYFADRQVTTNDNIGYYVLPYGCFTYRSRSDTDIFVFNRNNLINKGIISYYYPVFKTKNSNSNFLLRRLNFGIKRQLSMAAEGTGQKVLAHSKFKNMVVDIPKLDEQEKIGNLFEQIDNLITLHQRKYDKLLNIKKSLLEKMFPKNGTNIPEIRFKGFTDAWEQRELWEYTIWDKNFNEVEKIKQPKTIKYPYLLADEFKRIEDSTGDVQLLSTGQYIGFTSKEKAGKYLCNGEVVTIPWGGVPNIKYFKGFFVTTDNRIATSSDIRILNNKYLYYLLNHNISFIEGIYRGASIKHPSMSDLLDMKIMLPNIDEQERISKLLTKIDNLITLHQRKYETLKNIKQSLLEKMFI